MAKLTLNRGSSANDGTGDNLRDGANKVNLNFTEIYTAIGDGTTVDGTWKLQDDSSTEAVISANGEVLRILGGTAVTSTLSGNDLTIALDTSAVVTASGTATLTNKTIALGSNTVSGTTAQFNTALTDGSFATLAGSEVITNKTIDASSNTLSNITNSMLSGSAGITNANLANSSISITGDDSSAQTISLGGGILFTGGSGITTSISGNEITFATDGAVVTETSTDTLTNKTISGASNTLSNIGNSSLSNSSITLGDDTISLGGTQTTVTNLSLDGASGTIDLTSAANKIRFAYANTGSLPTASTYEGMFAYDYGGNNPYVADAGGWVKLLTENSSIADISNVGSIASITNGQALIWNSSAGRFDPGSVSTGGSDIDQAGSDVQDVGYVSHRSPDATVTQTITVTVATKTTEHYYYGTGSSNGYLLDGHEGAFLTLSPGVYKFDLADGSNSGHPFRLYEDAAKVTAYTTGVTTSGSGGSSGDHLTITVDKDTPQVLYYQCSSHAYMGHAFQTIGSESYKKSLSYSTTTGTGDGTTTPIGSITSGFTVDEVLVSVNGVLLEPTTDYTISGTTLTFASAPVSGAELAVRYLDNTSGTYSTQAYTGDGTTTRTITSGRSTDDLLVLVNGLMLVPGTDYSVSGTTLTFATAPATGAEISIRYLRLT